MLVSRAFIQAPSAAAGARARSQGESACPLPGRERQSASRGWCSGALVRAEKRRQAPDQTARTSPGGALRRPAATGRTRVQGRAAEGVLSSHTHKRVHRKRARGTHEKLVAGTGHAACMYTQSRWFVVAFPLHLHLAEGLLLPLPPKAATRRRRLARAAESGQCPHLDPGRGCPGGSAPAAARARSPWLPPSASRPNADPVRPIKSSSQSRN